MPLIHRTSAANSGLFTRWADCVQSEKPPYLIPGIIKRQHPFHLSVPTIGEIMGRPGLTLSISFSQMKYCKSALLENLPVPGTGGGFSGYLTYKAI